MQAGGQGLAVVDAQGDAVECEDLQQMGKEIILADEGREAFCSALVFESDGLNLGLGQLRRVQQLRRVFRRRGLGLLVTRGAVELAGRRF